ncbi:MAG: UvrD-helicase domain-containing protein [Polyangiaceae bacterium]|nr:UvrD-helicase domain-containing protein [Polyangiaceae bacterium]
MDVSDLNPSQREAVLHGAGPMLVLAGAGSGKTRVVTRRIGRLVEEGTPPWSIVAVTFTNKAAAEMRERAAALVGPKAGKELRVTTFHSFGLELLTKEVASLGFRGGRFAVFDQADAMGALREVLRGKDAGKRFDLAAILGRISVAKNAFQSSETWVPREGDEYDEIARELFPRYQAALRSFQAFDFDDLVTEAVHLLRRRDDVRRRALARIRYLLVDEYQDTNASQLELVRILASEHRNVAVVGDDDQSIYAWRGADVTNILDFERHFPGARVVKLEENYRSVASVLHVANAVLEKSRGKRHGKVLRPTREQGPVVELVTCSDPDVEAAMIATEIEAALSGGLPRGEIAVLYRSNQQAEALEHALRERGVAHRQIGGQKFYERKEVKDLLAYLKVALDPTDEMSLRRVINYPSRGLGDKALERLSLFATARGHSLWEAVRRASVIDELSSSALAGAADLERVVDAATARLSRRDPADQVARELAEAVGLREDLREASPGEAFARRWGNVEGILNVLKKHSDKHGGDPEMLSGFLRLLTLQTEEEEQASDVVTLSTMHGAKGLEWRLVFLCGLEEGFLPHARTTDPKVTAVTPQDIEEERRLFYVGITRARDRLVLSRCRARPMRGKPVARTPSRFLDDVPKELLVEREVSTKPAPRREETVTHANALLAALDGPPAGARPTRPRFR